MNLNKKSLISFSVIFLSTFLLSACTSKTPEIGQNINLQQNMNTQNNNPSNPTSNPQVLSATDRQVQSDLVAIKTKDGEIVIKLYPTEAPNTVKNFIAKAESGFYNGLTFHRVEPGFVVQGGDPKGNGTGGGQIKSEINTVPFVKGSVGLARGMDIEVSNDSQFYICLATETCQHLTNQYVNFGEVVSGFENVEKINVGDKILEISTKTK